MMKKMIEDLPTSSQQTDVPEFTVPKTELTPDEQKQMDVFFNAYQTQYKKAMQNTYEEVMGVRR